MHSLLLFELVHDISRKDGGKMKNNLQNGFTLRCWGNDSSPLHHGASVRCSMVKTKSLYLYEKEVRAPLWTQLCL